MFFFSIEQCTDFAAALGCERKVLEQRRRGSPSDANALRGLIGRAQVRPIVAARTVAEAIGSFSACLIWVCNFGIWPSSENLHLYYSIRKFHCAFDLLKDRPGHYLLGHERAEFITVLDLAIQFGWGAHVIPAGGDCSLFISHDEWMLVDAPADPVRISRIFQKSAGITLQASG